MRRPLNHLLVAAMLLHLSAGRVLAELPTARLLSISPAGGRAGTTQRVSIEGYDLDAVDRLHCLDQHLTAKQASEAKASGPQFFDVTVSPDASPGLYDLRAVGRYGITNPKAFLVTRDPVQVAPKGHSNAADALPINLNELSLGDFEQKLSKYFQINLTTGQRVWIETLATAIDSKAQPQFTVFDSQHRELASSLEGRTIAMVAPAAGYYILEIHDLLYRGGVDYGFGVRIADHPDAPPAPRRAWIAPTPTTKTSTQPPFTLADQFAAPKYRESFRFNAHANTNYWLEVFSERFGQPTSPWLFIQRVDKTPDGHEKLTDVQQGGPLPPAVSHEFILATRDPASQLNVGEAGIYQVTVRDSFRENPPGRFLLSVGPVTPDFSLIATPAAPLPEPKESRDVPLWSTFLRRGSVLPVRITILRHNNFAGDVRVHAVDLPAGLSANAATIRPGEASTELLIAASPTAPAWVGPVKFIGIAESGTHEIVHEALAGTVAFSTFNATTNDIAYQSRLTDVFMLAVSASENAPLRLTPATQPIVQVSEGAKVTIPFSIDKTAELTAAATLKLTGDPALAAMPDQSIAPQAAKVDVAFDTAQIKLSPGRHVLHAEGQATVKYDDKSGKTKVLTTSFYSPSFVLNVLPAEAKK